MDHVLNLMEENNMAEQCQLQYLCVLNLAPGYFVDTTLINCLSSLYFRHPVGIVPHFTGIKVKKRLYTWMYQQGCVLNTFTRGVMWKQPVDKVMVKASSVHSMCNNN